MHPGLKVHSCSHLLARVLLQSAEAGQVGAIWGKIEIMAFHFQAAWTSDYFISGKVDNNKNNDKSRNTGSTPLDFNYFISFWQVDQKEKKEEEKEKIGQG
jgi:hypothetical protein